MDETLTSRHYSHSIRIALWDRTEAWVGPIRHAIGGLGTELISRPDLGAIEGIVIGAPDSVVFVEFESQCLEERCYACQSLLERFPGIVLIGLLRRDLWPYERVLREIGFRIVLYHSRDMTSTTRLIHRHHERTPIQTPTLTDQIRTRLPWRDHSGERFQSD